MALAGNGSPVEWGTQRYNGKKCNTGVKRAGISAQIGAEKEDPDPNTAKDGSGALRPNDVKGVTSSSGFYLRTRPAPHTLARGLLTGTPRLAAPGSVPLCPAQSCTLLFTTKSSSQVTHLGVPPRAPLPV